MQRFVKVGDVVVAVYEHRIVEFKHNGQQWQAEPSIRFSSDQTLHGALRTEYDDASDIFLTYKYLTDDGIVNSEITGYKTA